MMKTLLTFTKRQKLKVLMNTQYVILLSTLTDFNESMKGGLKIFPYLAWKLKLKYGRPCCKKNTILKDITFAVLYSHKIV